MRSIYRTWMYLFTFYSRNCFPFYFFLFFFDLPLKLRIVYLRNKANELSDKHGILQTCSILFLLLCYWISKRSRHKVLLSVIWNPLLIEINLSQIRTLLIKHEKVCAVCPYLLFHLKIPYNLYKIIVIIL